jgi:hypothetical protein
VHLNLTNNALADILTTILAMEKPVLATGGGGYNIDNTVRGWALMWSLMCGGHEEDMMVGMGGVMMETTDWAGGLRDRALPTDVRGHAEVDAVIEDVLTDVRAKLFPFHGLD